MNQKNDIVLAGSISQIATASGKSLAESFLNVEACVIVDCSSSMEIDDSRGNRTRYDVACEELASLQQHMPGKIAIVAFNDDPQLCPGGQPVWPYGSTNLAGALRFAKQFDLPGMKFVLISDGEPNSPTEAMSVARGYSNKIDVIYVGSETHSSGRDFLRELARVKNGTIINSFGADQLEKSAVLLLEQGK